MAGDTQEANAPAAIEQELMGLAEQIKQRIAVFFEQQSQLDAQFTDGLSTVFSDIIGRSLAKNAQLAALKEENAQLTHALTENRNIHVEIQKHLAARKGIWADSSLSTQDIN